MIEDSGVLYALSLGFLLGLKHATDADHVVAVSTIVSQGRNIWRGIWVGGSWGLGHTMPLLVIGIVILLFKESVLDKYETIAPFLEGGVALMLIFLGAQVIWRIYARRLHLHQHFHKGTHIHIHSSHKLTNEGDKKSSSSSFDFKHPPFRVKSFTIGVVHGLAGTAAVMLLLLPQIESFWIGIGYLLLFGVGTVLSMSVITLVLGIPFSLSSGFKNINIAISGIAGIGSIAIGILITSDIFFGTSLMPF